MNYDSSRWSDFQLLICGYSRNQAFMAFSEHHSFRDFWQALANHFDVELDGEYLTNTTLTSVSLMNQKDAAFLIECGMITFEVECIL